MKKIKPVRAWAYADENGDIDAFDIHPVKSNATYWREKGQTVTHVLITPIQPKRKAKKGKKRA